jgi:hypothetical protein
LRIAIISLKPYNKKEGKMKKNLIITFLLIVWLMLQPSAATAEPSGFIVRNQDSTDENAAAGILKVAQNLRFPSSLSSSPPPLYPATAAPLQPLPPPPNSPTPSPQPVIPPKNAPESGITNPRTGEFYPGTFGGVTNPRTGAFMPKVDGGYLNQETGEVIPKR